MTINIDRPTDLYIPRDDKPDGFSFLASKMLEALKEYDCTTKREGTQHIPKGDYIQIIPNNPAAYIYACHIKAICQNAPKNQIIDAVYATCGLTLSYDNTSFNLIWQSPPEGSFIAHLATGDILTPTNTPDPWLQRACTKDKKRPELMRVYGNVATDGYRIHLDPRLEPSAPPIQLDVPAVIDPARLYTNIATIQVKPLVKAIKQAKVINKDILRLSFNGKLEVIAKSEESGDTIIPLQAGYTYDGPNVIMGIYSRFLLDALSGFDDEVMLCLGSSTKPEIQPLYITNGIREAVIMPLYLKQ